ncbi:hypothetical protein [Bradyrhizobium sp. Tv2a-2]|uniref:hypothetical protein n=1 Tax=Bradyrhizobium sp. Tv2a-2 TaxID=113395 RepID=UPI0004006960|nr:hypothetical protein [Bradyrhizobium sp. Tv2a-2]
MIDLELARQLDDQWRTPSSVRRHARRYDYTATEIVNALRALANSDRIERKLIDTGITRVANHRLGPTVVVEYFRRNQL